MMNRNVNRSKGTFGIVSAIALGGLLVSTTLTGCSAEEEEPIVQQRPAPAPPPPPAPKVRSVEELKAELRIDDRVFMTEDVAPPSTEARRAILSFFDAFARGDDRALGQMLSDVDRMELERMVESGQWRQATSGIEEVMIHQTGNSPNGDAVIALYDADGEFQVQLWYYTVSGDEAMFEAALTPPNMADRLSGSDWIAAWHKILEEEMELAMRPDQEVERVQEVLDDDSGGRDRSTSGGRSPRQGPAPVQPSRPTGPAPPRRTPGNRPPGQ